MSDINRIYLIGRLGQDPEIRSTSSDRNVANLSVATKYQDKTSWHRAVAWGKNADFVGNYLKKGDLVYLEGRMDYREWEKDGQKRTSAEIVVDRITGLGGKDKSTQPAKDYPEVDGNKAPPEGFDDIPF